MKNNRDHFTPTTPRENFLISLLHKIVNEYKALLDLTRNAKPFKIIEIVHLSPIPGESIFAVQITNKSSILRLTAAAIIGGDYNLDHFHNFHAEIIRQAAQGKLIEFLKATEPEFSYKILSKKYDKELKQYIFTIETHDKIHFTRSAAEIANDKTILKMLTLDDTYDLGYTQGMESILKEKVALLLAKTHEKK